MTEKAEKLIDTFNTKLNTILFLYEQGVNNFEESKDAMKKELETFDKCMELSLRYGLISINEFLSLQNEKPLNIYFKKYEVLVEKHVSSQ